MGPDNSKYMGPNNYISMVLQKNLLFFTVCGLRINVQSTIAKPLLHVSYDYKILNNVSIVTEVLLGH